MGYMREIYCNSGIAMFTNPNPIEVRTARSGWYDLWLTHYDAVDYATASKLSRVARFVHSPIAKTKEVPVTFVAVAFLD